MYEKAHNAFFLYFPWKAYGGVVSDSIEEKLVQCRSSFVFCTSQDKNKAVPICHQP